MRTLRTSVIAAFFLISTFVISYERNELLNVHAAEFSNIFKELERSIKRWENAQEEVRLLCSINQNISKLIETVIDENRLADDVSFNQVAQHLKLEQLESIQEILQEEILTDENNKIISLLLVTLFHPFLVFMLWILLRNMRDTYSRSLTFFSMCFLSYEAYQESALIGLRDIHVLLCKRLIKVVQEQIKVKLHFKDF